MSAAARRASPAGAGALCVFVVPRDGWPAELAVLDRRGARAALPAAGRRRLARLERGGVPVDEVLLLGRAGHVEVHGHGGVAVSAALARALGVAEAHEATQPTADTPRSLRAARALASAECGPLRALLDALVEHPPGGAPRELPGFARAVALLDFGCRLEQPPVVRLVGRPNAGKSTLFNRLLGSARALVSPRAGTTRDTLAGERLVAGVPVVLEDQAGVEGAPCAEGADLLVHLLTEAHEEPLPVATPVLRVLGRADLRGARGADQAGGTAPAAVSGLTGAGVRALLEALGAALGLDRPADDDLWAAVRAADRSALVRAWHG